MNNLRPPSRQKTTQLRNWLRSQRGMVLIVVLVAVVFMSLGAYTFTDLMLAHHASAQLSGQQVQARLLVDSGVDAMRLFLLNTPEAQAELGGTFDNPTSFQGVVVLPSEDPADRGAFSIVAPNVDSEGNLAGVRFGLENESTRLNLNALSYIDQAQQGAGRQMLMALPQMTEDVADAIMDWLDADSEPRELGCESEYYAGLPRPYAPRNGPLDTVEELLLVRGVTPQLLFGLDANRNGQLDPAEGAVDLTQNNPAANDPTMARGWSSYLTLYSTETNLDPNGKPRIFLNMPNMEELHRQLSAVFPADWSTFIVAYRQNGPALVTTSEPTKGESRTPDLTKPGQFPITQVFDLIGATTQCRFENAQQTTTIASPFSSELVAMNVYLPTLLDFVTVNPARTIPGRININQASATILRGIPGIDENIVSEIIARRSLAEEDETGARRHETWIMTTGICTMEQMRTLAPFMTCGGSVHRAQVVGYFQGGTAASRAEVIWETSSVLPRVLFWRDISHLGRGYAVETLGVSFEE